MSFSESHASERTDCALGGEQAICSADLRLDAANTRDRSMEPRSRLVQQPWGRFEVLAINEQVSVKILTVAPGGRLSLQRHQDRDEWWHIIDDGLVVEIDGEERPVAAGERVWVPRGGVHRVCNTGGSEARFVELAFGHFDEQDIERLADDYGRGTVPEQRTPAARALTVVIPSFNERDNVTALVGGLEEALRGTDAEILYVDDSTDDTADVVRELAWTCRMPLRVLQREEPRGGLAGAVRDGMCEAKGTYIVVMDADLQHPPALVPVLLRAAQDETVDIVVASRYRGDGAASGLNSSWRRSVSSISTVLARSCFPRRVGRVCSDPMTGFFCVRRETIDIDRLRPRGFKILLEVLARHDLRVAEVPFTFGRRGSGESKASWRHGVQFLLQMATLRMGRMSRFAAVGALGTLVNLAVMWFVIHLTGLHYVGAAVVATEVAIMHNFLMQERYVFGDMRDGQHQYATRMAHFFAFNNLEMLVRTPLLVLLVSGVGLFSVFAQALTLAAAFLVRFCWVTQVVYRPRTVRVTPRRSALSILAGYVAVQSWSKSNSVRGRVLSALRPASRPSRQALQLSIPVAITLVAFPALPVRIWHLLSDGGRPAAILVIVTACAIAGIALRLAPAPGEPDVHDRQLDVILAVPFVGGCVWLASGWPEQFGIDQPLTGRQIIAATALLAGVCLLVVGTRLSARLRFVLLLPLIAMPQVAGRPALLLFLVTVTIAGTLLPAIARYRRRDRIAAAGTDPIADESTEHELLPLATGGTALGQSVLLRPRGEPPCGRHCAASGRQHLSDRGREGAIHGGR